MMNFELSSSAFKDHEKIPQKYTGDGEDISPDLKWSGAPSATKEFALICEDPDAPTDGEFVHWVVFGIPGDCTQLPEAIEQQRYVKASDGQFQISQGKNSFKSKNIGYRGPMPPKNHGDHHYYFKLYALDEPVAQSLESGMVNKWEILEKMGSHIIGEARLVGVYAR